MTQAFEHENTRTIGESEEAAINAWRNEAVKRITKIAELASDHSFSSAASILDEIETEVNEAMRMLSIESAETPA